MYMIYVNFHLYNIYTHIRTYRYIYVYIHIFVHMYILYTYVHVYIFENPISEFSRNLNI